MKSYIILYNHIYIYIYVCKYIPFRQCCLLGGIQDSAHITWDLIVYSFAPISIWACLQLRIERTLHSSHVFAHLGSD